MSGKVELINKYNGAVCDICHKRVRAFINANSDEGYCAGELKALADSPVALDKAAIAFCWRGEPGEYRVLISENPDFLHPLCVCVSGNELNDLACFLPGKTYYIRVESSNGSFDTDSFTTLDAPVRYITAGGMRNIRDLGGWRTLNGKRIKYGLLFRGGAPDEAGSRADGNAVLAFNSLGVKTEIDLREPDCCAKSFFAGEGRLITAEIFGYIGVAMDRFRPAINTIFQALADKSNYPIYFHCSAGADRTGTLAYLIQSVLGVPYRSILCDYELSSFSGFGLRARGVIKEQGGGYVFGNTQESVEANLAFEYTTQKLREKYGGNDHTQTIVNYLKDFGITNQQLDSIRSIMLGE